MAFSQVCVDSKLEELSKEILDLAKEGVIDASDIANMIEKYVENTQIKWLHETPRNSLFLRGINGEVFMDERSKRV